MHGLELATCPFLMVGGQLILPELEGVVGITWSICLVLQVRRLSPREGKRLAQEHTANATQRWVWTSNLLAPISRTDAKSPDVVKLWDRLCCFA